MARLKTASERTWSRPNHALRKTPLTSALDNFSLKLNFLWVKHQRSIISKVQDCLYQVAILALNMPTLNLTLNTRPQCIHTPSTAANRLWGIIWLRLQLATLIIHTTCRVIILSTPHSSQATPFLPLSHIARSNPKLIFQHQAATIPSLTSLSTNYQVLFPSRNFKPSKSWGNLTSYLRIS